MPTDILYFLITIWNINRDVIYRVAIMEKWTIWYSLYGIELVQIDLKYCQAKINRLLSFCQYKKDILDYYRCMGYYLVVCGKASKAKELE